MKKIFVTSLIAALTFAGSVQARHIIDRTNNFFINLPDRFLLDTSTDIGNKYVVLNAYDPEDEASFIIKISPSQLSEVSGVALDNERSKFRNSLSKMGLDPYVEGITHITPGHESVYTFSKIDDQGEVLNYLMAKFWAHGKEYSFFCIQPTKTLKTQEFLDSLESFICLHHQNYTLPSSQRKARPEYDKAKDMHDDLMTKADLNAKKLIAEGKKEEAEKVLAAVPKFVEKPTEYIPTVEINGTKPLPADITNKVAHDALYSEHPEQVWARAKSQVAKPGNQPAAQEDDKVNEIPAEIPPEADQQTPGTKSGDFIIPPPINRNSQGQIIIRDNKTPQDYNFQQKQERQLTKQEIKQLEKMKKEREKFEKEQAKRQAKLDKLRKKNLEKAKKEQNDDD